MWRDGWCGAKDGVEGGCEGMVWRDVWSISPNEHTASITDLCCMWYG